MCGVRRRCGRRAGPDGPRLAFVDVEAGGGDPPFPQRRRQATSSTTPPRAMLRRAVGLSAVGADEMAALYGTTRPGVAQHASRLLRRSTRLRRRASASGRDRSPSWRSRARRARDRLADPAHAEDAEHAAAVHVAAGEHVDAPLPHSPRRRNASLSLIRRAAAITRAKPKSAVVSVSTPGALADQRRRVRCRPARRCCCSRPPCCTRRAVAGRRRAAPRRSPACR